MTTSKELYDDFQQMGPQPLRVYFRVLADKAIDARLRDGQRINDVTDVVAWLRELEEQATIHPSDSLSRLGRSVHDACPHCGHVHQDDRECGEQIGGGRICRCER